MDYHEENLGGYMAKLEGKKIAIVATHGFEESELFQPMEALKNEGATVEIVSLKNEEIKSWKDKDWGRTIQVDHVFSETKASDYDGMVLPGGVINDDTLRGEDEAVEFVKSFAESGKPIAVICHGAWILVEADIVHDCEMTSWHSLKTDLQNAGAVWVDREVVVDNGLVSSRYPDDIPAFNRKMIEEFAEGKHTPRKASAEFDDDELADDDTEALQVHH